MIDAATAASSNIGRKLSTIRVAMKPGAMGGVHGHAEPIGALDQAVDPGGAEEMGADHRLGPSWGLGDAVFN